MVGAGGFKNDPGNRRLTKPLDQRPKAPGRVFKLPRSLILQPEGIEMVFEISMPMVCSAIFAMSSSCHAWRKHAYPFRLRVKTAVDPTRERSR